MEYCQVLMKLKSNIVCDMVFFLQEFRIKVEDKRNKHEIILFYIF